MSVKVYSFLNTVIDCNSSFALGRYCNLSNSLISEQLQSHSHQKCYCPFHAKHDESNEKCEEEGYESLESVEYDAIDFGKYLHNLNRITICDCNFLDFFSRCLFVALLIPCLFVLKI